jgi:DNA-binding NtrC family response regulator
MKILLADDQSDILEALRLLLEGEGFDPAVADSPEAILAALGQALRKGRQLELENASLRARQAPSALEEMTLEAAEKSLIQRALVRSSGNITDAARALGLSRSALYRRLQHFGLRGAE